ncbi:MAG: DNA repair protein RecO [Alphaproteobacteria bacterium MarineAlpha11_Bin1]|nr:MAG: DNA repair protein RecO [Alphaproteobacteria bacterium MarineAlpha11_Bin1]|tara:strand:+ start:7202 stop:7945 length:744 start_codon:yes stop_codon:yes gene_type:complete
MNWTDEGIVLSARKHGESGAIVTLMTRENGRHAGLVRGGSGSRARGIYQTGNLVSVGWRARLSEHLGAYTCELLQANAALIMPKRLELLALSASAALVERLLPEREPQPDTFGALAALIQTLTAEENWLRRYVEWELGLLNQLGYGLDLTKCAATGSTEDLVFVSPRTGCAVSYGPGKPYREKLFDLPSFFKTDVRTPSLHDIVAGLRITGHFLARCAKDADAGVLPKSRARFVDQVVRNRGDSSLS